MKISVIIPVYNVEKYLEQCIDSVLCQSCIDFDVILIDDGSTDNSGVICDQYAAKNTRVKTFHKTNAGVSSARNLGIQKATGDFIWFVDGDDQIAPNSLRKMSELLNGGICVLGFDFLEFTESPDDAVSTYVKNEIPSASPGNLLLSKNIRFAVWSFIYKREFLVDNQLTFHEGVWIYEDNLFNIEVFNMAYKVKQVNIPFYLYRKDRSDSAMQKKDYKKIVQSCVKALYFLKELKPAVLSRNEMDEVITSFVFSILIYSDKIKSASYRKDIWCMVYNDYNAYLKNYRLIRPYEFDLFFIKIFKERYIKVRDLKSYNFFKKVYAKIMLILKD